MPRPAHPPKAVGSYSELGYEIIVTSYTDSVIENYTAGNAHGDSQRYLPKYDKSRLPLKTIKEHCESTLAEMAEEHGAINCGADYDAELFKAQ